MTHTLKHYKIRKDGSLKLIRTEMMEDPPRPRLDFASLVHRDACDRQTDAARREMFEALADSACEIGG